MYGLRHCVTVCVVACKGYDYSVTVRSGVTGLRRSLAPGQRDARTAAIGASQTGLRRSLAPGQRDARTALGFSAYPP